MVLIALQQSVNGLNSSGAEDKIFQENLVNTIAADAIAPWVPPAAMLLTT